MKIEKCRKASFTVIGKEGSTNDGEGFIQKLWENANLNYREIEHLKKKNENGEICGVWGLMSDFSRSFLPWENNFSEGLYLAGLECDDHADAPEGWTKWVVPGFEYLRAEGHGLEIFPEMIEYLNENHIPLAGAAFDFTDPKAKKDYVFFPIRKL